MQYYTALHVSDFQRGYHPIITSTQLLFHYKNNIYLRNRIFQKRKKVIYIQFSYSKLCTFYNFEPLFFFLFDYLAMQGNYTFSFFLKLVQSSHNHFNDYSLFNHSQRWLSITFCIIFRCIIHWKQRQISYMFTFKQLRKRSLTIIS